MSEFPLSTASPLYDDSAGGSVVGSEGPDSLMDTFIERTSRPGSLGAGTDHAAWRVLLRQQPASGEESVRASLMETFIERTSRPNSHTFETDRPAWHVMLNRNSPHNSPLNSRKP
eukprot:gene26294-57993_t